jgi:hypothetical protein
LSAEDLKEGVSISFILIEDGAADDRRMDFISAFYLCMTA